ncbi:DUF6153 family protein [Leucobacter sp. NPDC077196]
MEVHMTVVVTMGPVRDSRSRVRALFKMVAITVGVIAGLLAMHSFNSHLVPARHSATVETQNIVGFAHPGADEAASDSDPAGTPSHGCMNCTGSVTWMECALALLLTVALFIGSRLSWRTSVSREGNSARVSRWKAHIRPLPPPSLEALGISRT